LIRLPIGACKFKEEFWFADGENVVGEKRFELGFELDGLRFVAPDVLEELLDLLETCRFA